MGDLDPAFIQHLDHRPKPAAAAAHGIPLIDLSLPESESVSQIGSACKNWGFFQVINHGFPPEKLERLLEVAGEFFALPMEEKKKASRDERSASGYYDTEHTKNVRDWKEVFDYSLQDPVLVPAAGSGDDGEGEVDRWSNRWSDRPSQFREVCEEYSKEIEKLSFRIMELISLSLGLPRNRFNAYFQNHQTSFVRLNYYPPCPAPELALGVGRHKDSGALTVLAQDNVGGLEVKRKSDGEWVRVKPTPNAYIINIGDIFQVWSNGIYESVEHRVVVNSEKERFSVPFFFNPAHDVTVEPLPELLIIGDKKAAKYKPYKWGRFLVTRRHGDFKKLDVENIQIDHFVVSDKEKT